MADRVSYNRKYNNSWALVIGINSYAQASPLTYACNDANVIASELIDRFNFPKENVTILLDDKATRQAVISSILRFVETAGEDDRIIMFYAGHGCTRTGRHGEVGYLVPWDGDKDDLSSLIRWDELTRNSELIPAKHMLFIMDACYGGLALARALPPGSSRFVGDMLSRYTRQVLTAGKADELVADSGGPRPGHSVFTGHLLEALTGASIPADGVLSANAIMAYVYDRVAKDPNSRQSPHFGFIDGDGDLMFRFPTGQIEEDEKPADILVQVPADLQSPAELSPMQSLLDAVKEYLSDTKYRIRLDDFLVREVRAALQRFSETEFPLQAQSVTGEDIAERLSKYENAMKTLLPIIALVGRWVDNQQLPAIERIIGGFSELNEMRSGNLLWLRLRAYPATLLLYAGGIAALEGKNYVGLATIFNTPVRDYRKGSGETVPIVVPTIDAMLDVDRADGFKKLSAHERNYAPRSEYLFTRLQPTLEDILGLGGRYETLFDRFEVLYSLVYADLTDGDWGPPGRFAWKYRRGIGGNPFKSIIDEAKDYRDRWPVLQAGLFRGSHTRFEQITDRFQSGLLNRLPWH
jgi:Caspase domain